MKYKKFFAILLVLTWITTGCGPSPAPTEEQLSVEIPVATQVRPFSIKIAAGGPDGLWVPLANSISAQVTENIPNVAAAMQSTSSVMDNLKLVTSGKVGMAFGYDYHVILANQGKLMSIFPDAQPEKLHIKCGVEITRSAFPDYSQPARIVMALYEQPLHVITMSTTGIAMLSDLKGKRVSTGAPNSSTEEQAGYVLKALGLDWDKDFTREQLDVPEAVAALKDGRVDAFFWSGAVPTPAIIELASMPDMKMILLPISGEDAEKIMQFNPGIFHYRKILAGSYSGLEADVDTLAVTTVLIAMEDFSANTMKQVVSTIFENKAEIASVWMGAYNLTPETSVEQLSTKALSYLHKDSAEYFEEQGVLKNK